jgi:uncharacterized protein (DUF58 family)
MKDWWMRLCRDAKVSYTFAAVQLVLAASLALMGSWLYAFSALIFAAFLATNARDAQTISDLRMELRIQRSVTTILRWGARR